ncbi:MAG: PRC-barrel domain-containing protein [Rubrobacter sp.]|nr:PRC-barrel domain-containing protein [Rubrobacter sp.]
MEPHRTRPAGGREEAATPPEPRRGGRERVENPSKCRGYAILDAEGKKFGEVGEVFANPSGEPEYIRVKMLFKSVLLPVEMVEVDDGRRTISLR